MTPRGPAQIVLLHGVGLDRHMWEPVQEELAAHGQQARALDLLGHGEASPAPAGTTLADLARAIVEQLEGPCLLVGFSLGALVAQHIAIHHPDLVTHLGCVSSVCRRTADERAAVLARLDTASKDLTASADAAIRRWYAGTDVPARVQEQTRRTLEGNDRESYLAAYRVFATGDAEVANDLDKITVPTLAITGSDDPGSTPQMSRRLADALAGCEVVIVEGARHMLPVQRPVALVDALLSLEQRQSPNAMK